MPAVVAEGAKVVLLIVLACAWFCFVTSQQALSLIDLTLFGFGSDA